MITFEDVIAQYVKDYPRARQYTRLERVVQDLRDALDKAVDALAEEGKK